MNRQNLELLETYYQRWKSDSKAVEPSWNSFFQGFELGLTQLNGQSSPTDTAVGENQMGTTIGVIEGSAATQSEAQASVTQLVNAYRELGHYQAHLDPLGLSGLRDSDPRLSLKAFGLGDEHLESTFYTTLFDPPQARLIELIDALRQTYCRSLGVEYMHIRDSEARNWLKHRMEACRNQPRFDVRRHRRILLKLNAATLFESFLHLNYRGQKRFSLEGGETLIPVLDAIIDRATTYGVKDAIIGMPHRGRLNVLVNILNKPYALVFHEFEGNMPLETVAGDGDVKYHLGYSGDYVSSEARKLHLSLSPNPSHLEAVNPVVEGRMRGKQRPYREDRTLGLPILIHGDAAFAGQGLISETLNLSQLPGYRTGGTVHVIVNNQIGFTTSPNDARSSRYCTDVAKMLDVPIFHVNAEDPDAAVYVAELALDFRQTFARDVVIDMVCYRKHGHNEGDEPRFTQPLMYRAIDDRASICEKYTASLVDSGMLTPDESETIAETFRTKMRAIYNDVQDQDLKRAREREGIQPGFGGKWSRYSRHYSFDPVATAVSPEGLIPVVTALTTVPEGFQPHQTIAKQLRKRVKAWQDRTPIDWAYAESLAFGTLLRDGHGVRLSGQDSRRGTFSQRHAMLVDTQTGTEYYPLRHIEGAQAGFCAYDSTLSEAGVLGFDYGYSLDAPEMLIMWEAQFGDFCNGAQVIIDQFIASAESKWGRASGLVMLLPHGYEGQGPEHSSARLERFLQLYAEENLEVVNATTPAQYFHLLRRQVLRDVRKPLIVMTPKSLLREKLATSPWEELSKGTFQTVLDDPAILDPASVRRVAMCSGKVYYDLLKQRNADTKDQTDAAHEVALIRLEQFSPWPSEEVQRVVGRYHAAEDWIWVQEESQNMGGWSFVADRLKTTTGRTFAYVGRDPSASPATGSKKVHDQEQAELVRAALGESAPHLVRADPYLRHGQVASA